MTNINVIENKLSEIQKYLHILTNYKQYSQSAIENDVTLKGALERYLYLVIQCSIDTAEAVIALKMFRKPIIYSDVFTILHEKKIIPEQLTKKLIKMVGFINIITHDYADIDFSIVYDVLHHCLTDIELFSGCIYKKIISNSN